MEKLWTYPIEAELCEKKKARPVWKSPRGSRGWKDQAVGWWSRAARTCFLDRLPRVTTVGLESNLTAAPICLEIHGESMITYPGFPIQARVSLDGAKRLRSQPQF